MTPAWWPIIRTRPLDDTRWVVLDVETTGLDPRSDDLLALSAVALRHEPGGGLRLLGGDSFDALIARAEQPVVPDRQNILVHGIGVAQQQAGADAAHVLEAFEQWSGDAPRLGFHVDFDRVVLERALRQRLGRRARAHWIDIAPLARSAHPRVKAQALDDWLVHFGIPCAQRHEAAADTLATAELLLLLWPALRAAGARGAADLEQLARAERWTRGQ